MTTVPLSCLTLKGKDKVVTYDVQQQYPFEGFNIFDDGPTQLMSSFSQWINEGLYKNYAKKKDKDGHYLVNCSRLGFEQLDFHMNVIFYYLRKKSKQQSNSKYRYTTTDCFFKIYIEKANVVHYEKNIVNIIKGYFSITAGLPWHMTDEVYIPVNCNDEFHWVLTVIVLKERCIKGKNKSHPFEVKYVARIAQQASDSLDCGLFITEFLSDGLQVPSSGIVVESLCMRYASLLWNYEILKAQSGYVSNNEDS
ncbi:hypothetical protein H5410_041614 [Solanum commersonii]|uniref:Ubiquitin-like protease family profile domain-containing protein n=1 Tax=Solanum commersonii TaxID=4109 RepID=A0A9J5XV27_SOLCO|nr:hypothetical protein H5410_041614 [Solanum commersonii]